MQGYKETHKTDDMRMQRCKTGHMNQTIQECKVARINRSTHQHKDMRMQSCENTSKCKGI